MSIIFCDVRWIVYNHMVPAKTTVVSMYYSSFLLSQLQRVVKEKNPELGRSGFILHQDNAPVHTSRLAQSTIQDLSIEPLPHPPYSPDWAICDSFLFPTVRDQFRGIKYESRDELGAAKTGALLVVSRDGIPHVFLTWMERCHKCIRLEGSLKKNNLLL